MCQLAFCIVKQDVAIVKQDVPISILRCKAGCGN